MKTFVRLIRRYVLTAVAVVLLLLVVLCVGLLAWLGWRESRRLPQWEYASGKIADSMVQTENGLSFGAEHTPQEWMDGYEWAMVLGDDGNIIWQYDLPEKLRKRYTSSDIARFSEWYLEDYPVFCWTESYGLFVIGMPKGSLWRYSVYTSPGMLTDMVRSILPAFAGLLGAALALCFVLSWRGAKRLQSVAEGLDALAEGRTLSLPVNGFAGEVAEQLNRTSAHLQQRSEIIARRDNARTQWIAGVSHDVRTPLSLMLGWAEQLESDTGLPEPARRKAGGIRTQSEKLRALIDDLNLTSKLQYGAQPLRRERYTAGPLLRELVAQFCDGPTAGDCEIALTQSDSAEHTRLSVDRALLGRLLENLLGNSVRHNAPPVRIEVQAQTENGFWCLIVTDNGQGYPPAVLAALHGAAPDENTPHILGMHVVEQIARAHGGSAVFENTQHGAKATVRMPYDD